MNFYLPVLIGVISLLGISFYSIFLFTSKRSRKVKEQILNGNKQYIVHWIYSPNVDLFSFQKKGSPLRFYKKKLSNIHEIYICSDGVLFGDVLFYDWGRFAKYKKLAITTDQPPCIQFKIEFGDFDTATIVEFFIPIPKGKELEAVSVVKSLYGKVPID